MIDSEQTQVQEERKGMSRKKMMIVVSIVFLVLGLLWFLYWLIIGRFEQYTDDAYVNGNLVPLMARVSGTIVAIKTDDTYLVEQGQTIILLDEVDKLVALERAKANLAYVIRKVRQSFLAVKQARAVLALESARLDRAKQDKTRRVGLDRTQAISVEDWQHIVIALRTAEARYQDAIYRLSSATALVENTTIETHPQVEKAKAEFKSAYLEWMRTTIRAPVTGYIAKRAAQVGQQVSRNTPLLAIVPLNTLWVDANYKETQLNHLRIGQNVDLSADINGHVYHGKIVGLEPGTGSIFSLLPPQNATGNWIKIVQRLPVRISLDPKELRKHPLQIGLSVETTAYTRGLKGKRLASLPFKKTLYSTSIYDNELREATQAMNNILKENIGTE